MVNQRGNILYQFPHYQDYKQLDSYEMSDYRPEHYNDVGELIPYTCKVKVPGLTMRSPFKVRVTQSLRGNRRSRPYFTTYKNKVGTITTLLWEDSTWKSDICGKDVEDREFVIRFNRLTSQPLKHVLKKHGTDGRWRFQATVLLSNQMRRDFDSYGDVVLIERGNEKSPVQREVISGGTSLISKDIKVNKLELTRKISLLSFCKNWQIFIGSVTK